jgi:hypothetical protein
MQTGLINLQLTVPCPCEGQASKQRLLQQHLSRLMFCITDQGQGIGIEEFL